MPILNEHYLESECIHVLAQWWNDEAQHQKLLQHLQNNAAAFHETITLDLAKGYLLRPFQALFREFEFDLSIALY